MCAKLLAWSSRNPDSPADVGWQRLSILFLFASGRIVSVVHHRHSRPWSVVLYVCHPPHLRAVAVTQKRCDAASVVRLAQWKHRGAVSRRRREKEAFAFFVWLTAPCSFVCLTVYATGQISVLETYVRFCVLQQTFFSLQAESTVMWAAVGVWWLNGFFVLVV